MESSSAQWTSLFKGQENPTDTLRCRLVFQSQWCTIVVGIHPLGNRGQAHQLRDLQRECLVTDMHQLDPRHLKLLLRSRGIRHLHRDIQNLQLKRGIRIPQLPSRCLSRLQVHFQQNIPMFPKLVPNQHR